MTKMHLFSFCHRSRAGQGWLEEAGSVEGWVGTRGRRDEGGGAGAKKGYRDGWGRQGEAGGGGEDGRGTGQANRKGEGRGR